MSGSLSLVCTVEVNASQKGDHFMRSPLNRGNVSLGSFTLSIGVTVRTAADEVVPMPTGGICDGICGRKLGVVMDKLPNDGCGGGGRVGRTGGSTAAVVEVTVARRGGGRVSGVDNGTVVLVEATLPRSGGGRVS